MNRKISTSLHIENGDQTVSAQRQNPDGTWTPAEPIPWQPGIDWEVYGPGVDGRRRAIAYDGPREVTRISAKSRLMLGLRMRFWTRRLAAR